MLILIKFRRIVWHIIVEGHWLVYESVRHELENHAIEFMASLKEDLLK
jgi:hypothetical protein